MPVSSRFRYKELAPGEIRLLVLLPGDSSSPISCSIEHAQSRDNTKPEEFKGQGPSNESPAYEALSYTWDDEAQAAKQDVLVPESITLDSVDVPVTCNLGSALQHLRYTHLPRVFWIDALCIDQENAIEKEQQVQNMHKIYSNAKQVIIWLGASSSDSPQAFQFINEISSCFDNLEIQRWMREEQTQWSEDTTVQQQVGLVEQLVALEHASSWIALHRLMSRGWWSRAWVLQEMVVGRQVVVCCGSSLSSWQIFALAIYVCRLTYASFLGLDITIETSVGSYEYEWPTEHIERAFDMLARRAMHLQHKLSDMGFSAELKNDNRSDSLSSWLSSNRHRACLMPQDKIFSILGLLNPALQAAIRPNYKQVVSTLYQNVIEAYTKTTGRIDLICHSQHSKWSPNQPSWVPDWQQSERAAVFADIRSHQLFPILKPPPSSIVLSRDFNTLSVAGRLIGTIKRHHLEFDMLPDLRKQRWTDGICTTETTVTYDSSTQNAPVPGNSSSSWWYFSSSLSNLLAPALAALPAEDSQWNDHFDLFFDMVRLKLYPNGSDWHELHPTPNIASSVWHPSSESDFNTFYAHLQGLFKSRIIVETDEFQIGVVPDFAQENDALVWLWGCSVPVVLRPIPRSNGGWSFIGDAYVYRLAEDEVFEEGKWKMFELV